jgi:hypothetical protein
MKMNSKGPQVRCAICSDLIQSQHVHDMATCKCGAISVDGGNDYLKLNGNLRNFLSPSGIRLWDDNNKPNQEAWKESKQ